MRPVRGRSEGAADSRRPRAVGHRRLHARPPGDFYHALERAHQAHLNAREALPAARCAFWVGINLVQEGEMGRAGGWLGRAQRLVDREGRECVEQGYLLIPVMFEREAQGDLEGAIASGGRGDADRRAVR